MPYDYPIRFGKYFLTRRIAVGGMAEVFKAKLVGIKGFEKTLALKRILPEFSEDEEFVQMFVDEARISSTLHHNNIVQVFDFGKVESAYYIAMEHIDGVNLKNLTQRQVKLFGTFPRRLAYYVILQVARALDYAHNVRVDGQTVMNLVHRDVSPQNVLISRSGELKITDFGIAKAEIRLSKTQPGKIQGKFSYMSPEQAAGKPIDRRSDIFSLGIIAYELLSGMKVYGIEDTRRRYQEVREANVTRLADLVKDLPSEVESLVMQMLSKEAADRPQTCGEIAERFAEFLSDISITQLSIELGGMVDQLYPRERSDPGVNRRIQEMVERGDVPVDLNTEVVSISSEGTKPQGPVTKISTAEDEETTVAGFPRALFSTLLGRLALVSVVLALLAAGWYWTRPGPGEKPAFSTVPLGRKTPEPAAAPTPEPARATSFPTPATPGDNVTQRFAELQEKLKVAEEQATETQKELQKAEKKVEALEKEETAPVPPKPCPADMVLIPAGNFLYGSGREDPGRNDLVEPPVAKMPNARFCIDRFEFPGRRGTLPKTKVSWTEAQMGCSGEGKRICTQEEWERACKGPLSGTHNRRYPYGDRWEPDRCNTEKADRGTGQNPERSLAAAGSFPDCQSPEGVFDLSGNADEWTSSQGRFAPEARVTKGGSSRHPDWATRCSSIREVVNTTREADIGFRCCKDAL